MERENTDSTGPEIKISLDLYAELPYPEMLFDDYTDQELQEMREGMDKITDALTIEVKTALRDFLKRRKELTDRPNDSTIP